MSLVTVQVSTPPWQYWAANDTVVPIQDDAIFIDMFRPPPNRFDYDKLPKRQRGQQQEKKKKDDRKPPEPGDELHIDDYA